MSRNAILISAPAESVFDVLVDPQEYAHWVVGAKRIRDVDESWPRPGSRFHHAVGAGPAELKDSTKVVEIDRPRRLVLEARFRPPGLACIELDVESLAPDRSRVTMVEAATINGPVSERLVDPLIAARNWWSLRRLKRAAEARGVRAP
jgi:uncharacterized protein YndB with AHSA1/START domain